MAVHAGRTGGNRGDKGEEGEDRPQQTPAALNFLGGNPQHVQWAPGFLLVPSMEEGLGEEEEDEEEEKEEEDGAGPICQCS